MSEGPNTIRGLYSISKADIKKNVKDFLPLASSYEYYIKNFSILPEKMMQNFCVVALQVWYISDQYYKAMYLLNYVKQTLNDKNKGNIVLNYDIDIEDFKNMISESSEKDVPIPSSDILSCSDFINVFNDPGSDTKVELKELLSKH